MAKPKQLSMLAVNKLHQASYGKVKRLNLSNGDYVDIHGKFKLTDCQLLVADYQATLQQLKEVGMNWRSTRETLFVYYMLLLKYFTSIGDVVPEQLDQMVIICGKLLDLGLMEEILEAFPQEELEKLNVYMQKIVESNRVYSSKINKGLEEVRRDEN